MAGEVHPVPFRTRKLSPLAPMVLRSSPWESRTSLTNEGHLRAEGPVTRVVAGPSFSVRGARARGSRPPAGGASLSGAPLIMSPGLVPGRLAPQRCGVPCKASNCASPSCPMAGRFCYLGPYVTLPSANAPWSFGTKRRAPSMPEALLRDGKAPLVRRASSRVESGRSSSCGLLRSLARRG